MLTIYRGNRLETLAARLARLVAEPVGGALAEEIVLVHNRGMARWLSLRLAEDLGICANMRFPLPSSFLWECFRRVLPRVPEISSFDPEVLTFRLMADFAALPDDSEFDDLHSYLAGESDERRFELARKIADTFDRYLVYRPDWIESWERGQESHWQARLWRRLVGIEETGGVAPARGKARRASMQHRVGLQRAFVERLRGAAASREGLADDSAVPLELSLPPRITLFGIAAVPPIHVDLFDELSRVIDVHLFVLDPCQEYWGEIVSDRSIARRGVDAKEQYLETGNALLASMGGLGRDFIDKVTECPAKLEEEHFIDPIEALGNASAGGVPDAEITPTLLAQIQADILHLRNRGDGDEDVEMLTLADDDDSIAIDSCHGPMREVEVLYDRLLDLFRREPDLTPSDIIVMTPDIETYAPYVEAVFGTVGDPDRRIPYAIADRSPRADSPLVDVFLDMLALVGGRFEATHVAAMLESSSVRRRFGFGEEDMEAVHRWIRDTGIRWGIDEASRGQLDLPATRDHTWRAGLDRMLLGYALPENGFDMFEDILPYGEIEGGDARTLGRFLTLATALFDLDADLRKARTADRWVGTLSRCLDRFFAAEGEQEREVRRVREVLQGLRDTTRLAGYSDEIDLDGVLAYLRQSLETPDPVAGFLGSGVTFCAMVPMRSIPFEVVCLIGLDDARYPRARKPLGFDLMSRDFRRGDRSGRDDDRYLFLEAILSARRYLRISYVGQNIRDNNAIPPSVLVSELLDVITRGYDRAGGSGNLGEELVTRHPLQAFSRRYFIDGGEPGLFSYSREQCEASRMAGRGEGGPTEFFSERLPDAPDEMRTVTVDDLVHFFQNPVQQLVRRRLGMYLPRNEGLLETREPFEMGRFAAEDLRSALIAMRAAGEAPADMLAPVRASGVLPHGRVGETLFEREVDATTRFGRKLEQAFGSAEPLEPLDLDLVLGDFRVVGRLDGLTREGLISYRLGAAQGRDHLRLWVRHLVLNVASPAGVDPVSRFLHERGRRAIGPVDDARALLEGLLELYWEGMHRPLPLFARTSYRFEEARRRSGDGDARTAAWKQWNSGRHPERSNVFYTLVYRDSNPLDGEFEELATRVFGTLLDHVRDVRDAPGEGAAVDGTAAAGGARTAGDAPGMEAPGVEATR